MAVPRKVPLRVPPGDRARRAPRYLVQSKHGWRFQLQLNVHSPGSRLRLATARRMVRIWLGPMSQTEARQIAEQLAVFAREYAAIRMTGVKSMSSVSVENEQIAREVIELCNKVMAEARSKPDRARAIAFGLRTSLHALDAVQMEAALEAAPTAEQIANWRERSRGALVGVAKLAGADDATLARIGSASPPLPVMPTASHPATRRLSRQECPTFGESAEAYIAMRIAKDGPNHPDIKYLRLRKRTFIEIIGDRPVSEYTPSDLQAYVSAMQYWPANATKRAKSSKRTIQEILDDNADLKLKPISEKTMSDGYVANIKTMMRHLMPDFRYRDPFSGATIRYAKTNQKSIRREVLPASVINKVFEKGIASGHLDLAIMPLLALLTSRRLGLLTYLHGRDLRQKDGVWVVDVSEIVRVKKRWHRRPVKTGASLTTFVLHPFFEKIGFVTWASGRPEWIFGAAHEHVNPAKYMSQTMNRHLKACGAVGMNKEVFHSLRHAAIDHLRDNTTSQLTVMRQSGHGAGSEHEKYGSGSLRRAEISAISSVPLPTGINFDVFKGLDFKKLSQARRTRGRQPKTEI